MTLDLSQPRLPGNTRRSGGRFTAERKLRTNFTINVVGAIIPLFVALVTVPIYVRHIGDARYGVLSIVWVLLGYFGFLDLGLSRAAANALARLRDAPQEARARVLVTTLALNLGLGLFGTVCLAQFGGYFLQHVLKVPHELKPEIAQAFPWIVALFPFALLSGVGLGTLESRERFLLANVIQVIGTAAGNILPVILAIAVSPSLAVVIPAAAIVRGLAVAAILIVVYWQEAPLSASHFDRNQASKLFSYGSWVTVSGIISPLLVLLDRFVIGSTLGVADVTYYAVPMNLVTRTQIFSWSLTRTLFPKLSNSAADEAHNLALRALMSLAYGYAAICAPAIVLTPVFFRYWIGADFASVSAPVAEILFFGTWINGLALVPFVLLQGQGRPDVPAKLHTAQILPFVGILWGLTTTFGITGAAVAWGLRVTADALGLFWAAAIPRSSAVKALLPPLLILSVSAALARATGPNLWEALGAAALIGIVAALATVFMVRDLRLLALVGVSRAVQLFRPWKGV